MMTRIVAERRADKYLADVDRQRSQRAAHALSQQDSRSDRADIDSSRGERTRRKWYGGKHWYADPENKYIFMFEGTIVTHGTFGQYQARECGRDQVVLGFASAQMERKTSRPGSARRGVADAGVDSLSSRRLRRAIFCGGFTRRPTSPCFATGAREPIGWPPANFRFVIYAVRSTKRRNKDCRSKIFRRTNLKEGGTIGGGGSSVLALINRAPHPNAAKVFINWYLSRQGQTVWQNVMNKKEVEASDSMRIDISKDDVLPDGKRVADREYQVIGFLDPEPVQKLLQEILK